MGGYLAYTEYKDSGVEWLGKIPLHWNAAGLTKYLSSLVDYRGKTPEKTKDGVFLVTAKNIKNGVIDYSLSQEFVGEEQYDEIMRRGKPEIGDVLLTTEAPLGEVANVDNVGIALAQRVIKMQGKKGILDNYFLKYWIMSAGFQQNLSSLCTGSTALGIKASKLCLLRVVLPSVEEQRSIARFLDYKTAQIDALIAKKEALLEKLAEKRTALISQAVTKGCDPTVPMKDSGIEWLGEIPSHWGIFRLRFIVQKIEQGWSPVCDNRQAEPEQWGVLKVGCVNGEKFDENENKALPEELNPRTEYEIHDGDILMSRSNTKELVGSVAIAKEPRTKLLLCDLLYRLIANESINKDYLVRLLRSSIARFQYERGSRGTSGSMQKISHETIKNLILPIPTRYEQKLICQYLNEVLSELDDTEKTVKEAINKFKEYRTVLITNAVTGKIDVRDIKLPEPEPVEAA